MLVDEPNWRDAPARLRDAGIRIASGMFQSVGEVYDTPAAIRRTGGVVPDDTWPATWDLVCAVADLAAAWRIDTVSFHAGFIPDGPAADRVVARVAQVADRFADAGVRILLETGQETATTLSAFLERLERPRVGVNFDPANMLLYDMGDPIDALRRLLPRVGQVHLKDAFPPTTAGDWGTEVVLGTGAVDWTAFLAVLRSSDFDGAMIVERESGASRVDDIREAIRFVRARLDEAVES